MKPHPDGRELHIGTPKTPAKHGDPPRIPTPTEQTTTVHIPALCAFHRPSIARASTSAGAARRWGRSPAAAAYPSGAGARHSKPPPWALPWASPRAASNYNSSCTAYLWRSSVSCPVLGIDCRQCTGQNKATSSVPAGERRLAYVRLRRGGGGAFFPQLGASMFSPSPCCLAAMGVPPSVGACFHSFALEDGCLVSAPPSPLASVQQALCLASLAALLLRKYRRYRTYGTCSCVKFRP